jgi:hypothetical protein
LDVSGSIQAVAFNTLSDRRVKGEFQPIPYRVEDLKPCTYINNQTRLQDIGFIAHELQETIPLLVEGEKDGEDLQSINYNGIVSLLIKEVKDLKNQIRRLEKK